MSDETSNSLLRRQRTELEHEVRQLREQNIKLDSQLEEHGMLNYELIHQNAELKFRNKLLEAVVGTANTAVRGVNEYLAVGNHIPEYLRELFTPVAKSLDALKESEVGDGEE